MPEKAPADIHFYRTAIAHIRGDPNGFGPNWSNVDDYDIPTVFEEADGLGAGRARRHSQDYTCGHAPCSPARAALDRRLPFLRRITLQDYKSIESAAIELHPLAVLVGRNGSGKSNFPGCAPFCRRRSAALLLQASLVFRP